MDTNALVIDFIHQHPLLATIATVLAVGWPLISGLLLLVLDKELPKTDEDWALFFQANPRLAAAASFLKATGLNVPAMVRSLKAFLRGDVPAVLKPFLPGGPKSSMRPTMEVKPSMAPTRLAQEGPISSGTGKDPSGT